MAVTLAAVPPVATASSKREATIEVVGLTKHFGDVRAVDGISFSAYPGECLSILGPNGAGKTTTLEILEGLQTATLGEVKVLGRHWKDSGSYLRSKIGLQLQESHFVEKATVEEIVRLFRAFYPSGMDEKTALELVGMTAKRKAFVDTLSGGQKQRLALAVAVVGEPDIIFLDEPTTGLDPVARREIWRLVERFKSRGRTLILTTHYLEEAERLADRVIIVDRGKIIVEGTTTELVASLGVEQVARVKVQGDPPLERIRGVAGVRRADLREGILEVGVNELHRALPAILELLTQSRCGIVELSTRQPSLEDVFIAVTGHGLEVPEAAEAQAAAPAST